MTDADADRPFEPNWYSTPGDTIVDILDEIGMSREEFGRRLDLPPAPGGAAIADLLLDGRMKITDGIAAQFEEILGPSAEFWIRREEQFREDLARFYS